MSYTAMAYLGSVTANTRDKCLQVLQALEAAQGKTLTHCWGMGGGEHGTGRAVDFMTFNDQAAGDYIANYLIENRARLGVAWVIWRQRIWNVSAGGYGAAGQWNPMEDRGDSTQNHYDHVHVLFGSDALTGAAPAPVVVPGVNATRPAPGPRHAFPLPDGYYFGENDGTDYSVSGRYTRSFKGQDATYWIKELVTQLERRGWNIDKGGPYLTVWGNDGVAGPEFTRLVLAFQRDQGLYVDGKAGYNTWTRAFFGDVTA